jgi:hypothetical protein
MRELIYLSEAKLGQFRPERGRRFRVREIGVPGIGQVGVDPPADSHLDDVVDHLAGIARWYTEDDLATGDWVQFETSLGYTIFESLLLFAEPPCDRRLVLHGSAVHLLGGVPVSEVPGPGLSQRPALRAVLAKLAPHVPGRASLDAVLDLVEEAFTQPETTPMSGFARVTTTGYGGLVVASPLFVAFARQ